MKKKGRQVDIIGNYENGIKRKKSAVEIKNSRPRQTQSGVRE